jgi:type III secretory pathway component EscS
MSEDGKKQDQLLETTDCLEAIGTLKSNKNLFFFICFISLLLMQGCFWLMATGHINYGSIEPNTPTVEKAVRTVIAAPVSPNTSDANAVNADPNDSWQKYSAKIATTKIDFNKMAWVIRVCNYLLIISSVVYAMSLLFGLMISLVGKLGGISHVTKAFFISLLFIVVIMPWQTLFHNVGIGTIYRPTELLASWLMYPDMNTIAKGFMYLRYVGLGAVAILLLLWAQLKSMKWSRNSLRRLGIVR